MSDSIRSVDLGCRDLAEIRERLSEIRYLDGQRGFTNEELAEARSFLMEKGIISPWVRSFSSETLNDFVSHLDQVRQKVPRSCEAFSRSIGFSIEESCDRFVIMAFSCWEPAADDRQGLPAELTAEEISLIGAASMESGVDDLFGPAPVIVVDAQEPAIRTKDIPSVTIMNEDFPSEREGTLWMMADRAYDALGKARRAIDEGRKADARGHLSEAVGEIRGMGITPEIQRGLWARHPGLALDARKLAIRAADLLHELGEDDAAFDVMAQNIAVPFGAVSLAFDYSFRDGFEYPPPKATSPECSYDRLSKSWAENTYQKLTEQLAGKIRCFDAAKSGGR
ncbi:MAG: hypothetical protein JXA24_04835 [Proteobacteria bacterium]|nr:hypothetical protein [Pseudomonadota bacterium]